MSPTCSIVLVGQVLRHQHIAGALKQGRRAGAGRLAYAEQTRQRINCRVDAKAIGCIHHFARVGLVEDQCAGLGQQGVAGDGAGGLQRLKLGRGRRRDEIGILPPNGQVAAELGGGLKLGGVFDQLRQQGHGHQRHDAKGDAQQRHQGALLAAPQLGDSRAQVETQHGHGRIQAWAGSGRGAGRGSSAGAANCPSTRCRRRSA